MQWVRENTRHGFPYWQEEATILICPLYGVMDLMDVAHRYDEDCIYLATVTNGRTTNCCGFRWISRNGSAHPSDVSCWSSSAGSSGTTE